MGIIQRALTRQLQSAALLLVLTGTIPEPALAQEGRPRAAFVSPRVACRFAPSSSAEVTGFLRPMDSKRRFFIEQVERTETGGGGEVRVFVAPAYTKWANPATVAGSMSPCWLNPMVAR